MRILHFARTDVRFVLFCAQWYCMPRGAGGVLLLSRPHGFATVDSFLVSVRKTVCKSIIYLHF
jgi:hypothetical protein